MEELLLVLFLTLFAIPYWVENRRIRKIIKGGDINERKKISR